MTDGLHRTASPGLDPSDLTPYLAGLLGQASLDRLAGRAHPDLDQHLAAISETAAAMLGAERDDPGQLLAFLVQYASGFVAAAIGGGWRPAPAEQPLDWELMRLAAICQLAGSSANQPAELG